MARSDDSWDVRPSDLPPEDRDYLLDEAEFDLRERAADTRAAVRDERDGRPIGYTRSVPDDRGAKS